MCVAAEKWGRDVAMELFANDWLVRYLSDRGLDETDVAMDIMEMRAKLDRLHPESTKP